MGLGWSFEYNALKAQNCPALPGGAFTLISIGCQVCIEACPFGTMQFNDNQEIAVKCNLCAERLADSKRPVCVSVCPWSHPRTLPHRLITELVVRNRIARRVFSPMDDLFYGKKPKPASPPKWATHS